MKLFVFKRASREMVATIRGGTREELEAEAFIRYGPREYGWTLGFGDESQLPGDEEAHWNHDNGDVTHE